MPGYIASSKAIAILRVIKLIYQLSNFKSKYPTITQCLFNIYLINYLTLFNTAPQSTKNIYYLPDWSFSNWKIVIIEF